MKRRWLVPEVVQTSAMDCGPASLKCLLEGFFIPVSYGRLREACQTDVDGTSIDVIEVVANQLGVEAQQVMLPVDHLLLPEADAFPAMVVVRQADGATHFVVIWRRHGRWLQVMDPAMGRRWTSCARFAREIYRHELSVPAADWREWAGSDDFLRPLRRRLGALGAARGVAGGMIDEAVADPGWRSLAALDAATRMTAAVLSAGGLDTGTDAVRLCQTLVSRHPANAAAGDGAMIPEPYWMVLPQPADPGEPEQLLLRGAVLLRVKGPARSPGGSPATASERPVLTPELQAALAEVPSHPGGELLKMLKADGLLAPLALMAALAIAVGGVLLETLLFRGLFDIAWELNLASQRLGAMLGVVTFAALLMMIEIPIAMESLRLGRHLETRLRMALLEKLPKLNDRYFQSRPISDMADRSHSVHQTRMVAGLGIQFLQALWNLFFTLLGITLIDPASTPLAVGITALAIAIPVSVQPLLNERDLRVRSHSGALQNFYLDSLLGLVPVRTHSAQQAVRREHEALLVEWVRSSRRLVNLSVMAAGLQSFACVGLAGLLLLQYFQRSGVTGGVLLLVYWTLKLPAVGNRLTALAHQYPAQRNILLRLLEPLASPEDGDPAASAQCDTAARRVPAAPDLRPPTKAESPGGMFVTIAGGSVVASGHTILQDIDLTIRPGEHVAVVGSSGAGKSTLVGLLLGWHRLSAGELVVDGASLTEESLAALRRRTAWVDPAIQIWNRSFLDNLRFSAQDESFERLGPAIESAQLRGVLEKLPLGLQTPLGESGALVSGGEGQRVRLARAMLQSATRLVLLDEPFRGLDRQQRRTLLAHARELWRDATLLCVTHDVGETLSFPRVLVIEHGRLVEDGCPRELAQCASRYRALLDSERAVSSGLWEAPWWRRLEIRQGRIHSSSEPVDT